MTNKNIKKTINDVRIACKEHYPTKSDDEIDEILLDTFFEAYCNDEIGREDLAGIADLLGYELKDEIIDEIEREKNERRN